MKIAKRSKIKTFLIILILLRSDKSVVFDIHAAMNPNGKGPRLDLKLNLSPPRAKRTRMELPNRSGSSSSSTSPTSPPSSCVSSELNSGESDQGQTLGYANSPEATSMVLVGCPRCLMYVMLSEDDPRCPKCKSTVLLDFLNDNNKSSRSPNNSNYRVNNQ